jgi:hypothetical protein
MDQGPNVTLIFFELDKILQRKNKKEFKEILSFIEKAGIKI